MFHHFQLQQRTTEDNFMENKAKGNAKKKDEDSDFADVKYLDVWNEIERYQSRFKAVGLRKSKVHFEYLLFSGQVSYQQLSETRFDKF